MSVVLSGMEKHLKVALKTVRHCQKFAEKQQLFEFWKIEADIDFDFRVQDTGANKSVTFYCL